MQVLLLETDMFVALELAEQLAELGHTVAVVPDVSTAATALRNGSYELVINHLRIGGGEARGFLQGLTSEDRFIPLMVTCETRPDDELSLRRPAVALIQKPYGTEELRRTIAELLPLQ